MRWFLDGAQIHQVSANQVDATTWNNATHHGMFLILNVAMGGDFPAAFGAALPTGATASGVPMIVDYVAVYQTGAGQPPPTSPPPTTPPPTNPPPTNPPPTNPPPASGTWAPFTPYTIGQVVTFNGASYRCRQAHTSLPGWEPPNVLALWLPI
jgi:hypothetical protein